MKPGYYCDCKSFRNGARKLDMLVVTAVKTNNTLPDLVPFKFCPWCGADIKNMWDKRKEKNNGQRKTT